MLPVNQEDEQREFVITRHSKGQWDRREQELLQWSDRHKPRKHPKKTLLLEQVDVDAELHRTLILLRDKHVQTEFSCAGVSLLDEPEDHSLYAYMTLIASKEAESFIHTAIKKMKHRLLVTFEPERNRYDLSSFYIGHNRSFCRLLERSAELF
ncbi:hypothetical protein GCM10008018_41900 [Paenibacillus marchantiophytorum]|uniref:Uncharacterized protein n=1 Tax=Paenibacillus marchantiophytorum TaxID=1619310 RepID=A0ABQ1EXL0_9BACL|nr:hypothetical protein [Paenibacillus marchantiophytorum]GFZ91223.1 hypothetical protein GCM10008018_41900 [Paenibacillus marchantiophytorum]